MLPCMLQHPQEVCFLQPVGHCQGLCSQVPDGDGALALNVLPRYVLRNLAQQPLQYKQQGTAVERDLVHGSSRPLHWPDGGQDLRVCVRVHEAGWMWSGAMSLDTPGDGFVKIRHK